MSPADKWGDRPIGEWALGFATKRGWAVFPLVEGGKIPLISKKDGGRGCLDATSDAETVRSWWDRWPNANIGVATGPVSGIFVLDIDAKPPKVAEGEPEGMTGPEALAELERRHGALPATLTASTGGGGEHRYFRWPKDCEIRNRGRIRLDGLPTALDCRGDGGYVAGPGSVHPSGAVYRWTGPVREAVDAPPWLLDLLRPVVAPPTGPRIAPPPRPTHGAETVGRLAAYGRKALDMAYADIIASIGGNPHDAIRNKALWLGRLIAGGVVTQGEAEAVLKAAGEQAGRKRSEVDRAIQWGFERGATDPFVPENRELGPPRVVKGPPSWEAGPPPGQFDDDPGIPLGDGGGDGWGEPPSGNDDPGPGGEDSTPARVRPAIIVSGKQSIDIVNEAWSACTLDVWPPDLYSKGGTLSVVRRSENGAIVQACKPVDVISLLMRAAVWQKLIPMKDPKDPDATPKFLKAPVSPPPKFIAEDMVASPMRGLPVIESVCYAPCFAPDGTLLTAGGYHPSARLWMEEPVKIPAEPMPEGEMMALLVDWLADFPFATRADLCHAIGLWLLPFVRPMIRGSTPGHIVEAPQEGTGKTLLARVLCLASLGREVPLSPFDAKEEERRKVITSALMAGRPVIFFDNIKGTIDSPSLEAATTSTVWADRLLGGNVEVQIPVRAIWLFTANNADLSPDMVRRVVRIRIARTEERPYDVVGFRHPDILDWTRKNHGRLVHAAVSMIQAWMAAGRPKPKATMGSYEEWSDIVGGVLEHAGLEGFLANRDEFRDSADPLREEWRDLVKRWHARHGTDMATTSNLVDLCDAKEADRWTEAREAILQRIVGRSSNAAGRAVALGTALAKRVDQVFDGWKIGRKKTGGIPGWVLTRIGDTGQ